MAPRGSSTGLALVFALLALLFNWFAGGQALLGRIDPALALPLLFIPARLLAFWLRRRGGAARRTTMILAAVVLLAGQGGLMAWFGHGFSIAQLLISAAATALALWFADWLCQWQKPARQRARAALTLLVALGWFVGGHMMLAALYAAGLPSASARHSVVMMTSLPMRWSGGGDLSAMLERGAGSAPALARLEQSFNVELVDSLINPPVAPGATLLLAHPRALAPEELVAIDANVRTGGRAVILADALSGWPIDYPLGDARNPPVTSLLTPLLDHWGISLSAATPGETKPTMVWQDGYHLSLFSSGHFDQFPETCQSYAQRRIVHCPIGRGWVWLVGDADLLFAPLWQPVLSGAAHLDRADNLSWLTDRLEASDAQTSGWLRPVWIKSAAEPA